MNKLSQILEGRIVLEERESPVNGTLTVVRDLLFGTYIVGGGLPQSGGLAQKIWKISLKVVKREMPEVKSGLIVGLGGGGIAHVIKSLWKEATIAGVDIDKTMVDLGMKYLDLGNCNVEISIEDAESFIEKELQQKKHYDLICFDTYIEDRFPSKFSTISFIDKVSKLSSKNGVVVFNRLYGHEDRHEALLFVKALEEVFSSVERVYPEANIMFICRK